MKVFRIFLYAARLYISSIILVFAFVTGKYRVGVLHLATENPALETWLMTLMPDSIVFEVDNSYLHVHEFSFKRK